MIFSALINLGAIIAQSIISIFPNSSGLPTEFSDAITWLAGYVGILSPIIPLDTLATVVSLVVAYELLIFAFKGFRWLFSFVPFVGGKG